MASSSMTESGQRSMATLYFLAASLYLRWLKMSSTAGSSSFNPYSASAVTTPLSSITPSVRSPSASILSRFRYSLSGLSICATPSGPMVQNSSTGTLQTITPAACTPVCQAWFSTSLMTTAFGCRARNLRPVSVLCSVSSRPLP